MAFSATRMLMAAAGSASTPPPITVYATFFANGSTSSLARTNTTYTGASASTGILSCWINLSALNTINTIFSSQTGTVSLGWASNQLTVSVSDGGSSSLSVSTATSYLSTGVWYNVLCSWNTNFAAGSKIITLYINNVNAASSIGDANSAFNVAYATNYQFGANGSNNGIDGCISETYFAPGQFIDFTVSGNRALFYNAGNPVYLGSNGNIPTGTAPAYYWKGQTGTYTNLGSFGGAFSNLQGVALVACGSVP